jgi:hypothetical protein
MSAELPKSERARLMAELDEFFPDVKHTERETHLLSECDQLRADLATVTAELQSEHRARKAATTLKEDMRAALETEKRAHAGNPIGKCNACGKLAPLMERFPGELLDMGAVCAWGCKP